MHCAACAHIMRLSSSMPLPRIHSCVIHVNLPTPTLSLQSSTCIDSVFHMGHRHRKAYAQCPTNQLSMSLWWHSSLVRNVTKRWCTAAKLATGVCKTQATPMTHAMVNAKQNYTSAAATPNWTTTRARWEESARLLRHSVMRIRIFAALSTSPTNGSGSLTSYIFDPTT